MMGRSSKEQASHNRERVVEAASRLFRQRGVDHVSVAEIMGALDMTTGGFYKHFASKEALVAEAFEFAFEQSAASWRRLAAERQDHPEGEAAAIVRRYFQKGPDKQACPMLAFAPHAIGCGGVDGSVEAYARGAHKLLEQFAGHGAAERGDASARAAEQRAMVLFAAMIGARLLEQATGGADWATSVQAAVQQAADVSRG